MSIDIDTTREHRRPADLLALVRAVEAALPADEAEWVEWKGTLPLDTAEGWFSISKQILGFANRDPDRAARFAGGLGYVLVGVQPQDVVGVVPVDFAQLDSWLRNYLGDEGPVWSPTFVTHRDKQILVVIIERPQWGDLFYPLRKSYHPAAKGQGADKGTVFVRGTAKTDRATDADFDMLQSRITRGRKQPPLEVMVGWQGDPIALSTVDFGPEAHQTWLDAQRERLLRSLRVPTESSLPKISGFQFGPAFTAGMSEPRSPEQYKTEVEDWLAKVDRSLRAAVLHELVDDDVNEVRLMITNPTERNLPSVQLKIQLSPGALAFDPKASNADRAYKFPAIPKPFGAGRPAAWSAGITAIAQAGWDIPITPQLVVPFGLDISNATDNAQRKTTLSFHVGNLRPRATTELAPFRLVTGASGGSITASWSATSTGVDGVCEGAFEIAISGDVLTPLDLVPLRPLVD